MEYIISILTCIGTYLVLYFAYIRPLKKEIKRLKFENTVQSVLVSLNIRHADELTKENKQLRSKGMYKVKKVGRPRKENK